MSKHPLFGKPHTTEHNRKISEALKGPRNPRYGKPSHPNQKAGASRAAIVRWGTGVERFWSRVDKTPGHGPKGECWKWTGGTISKGRYGCATVNGRTTTAHRLAWELANGRQMAPKSHACHTCDWGLCVRPAHVFEGTSAMNLADAKAKGIRLGRPQLRVR